MSLFKRKPWTGKTELLFSDKALTALILPLFLEAASKIGICRRQKQNRRSQSEKISYICDSITAG